MTSQQKCRSLKDQTSQSTPGSIWRAGRPGEAGEVSGQLGGHRGAVVDGDEAAVRGEQLLARGGGAVGDAAGGLVDALPTDALGLALRPVPPTQDPSGADTVIRGDLPDGEDGA